MKCNINIGVEYTILSQLPPPSVEDIKEHRDYFRSFPDEYYEFIQEYGEIELRHSNGQYLRIWGPMGCMEMDEGYGIRGNIPYAFPVGDDGGGNVIFYNMEKERYGLYHVGYVNLCIEDAIRISSNLKDLISYSQGIEKF